jgi:hypothetical protein
MDLLASTLNAVEDEFTNIPFDPSKWETDGRMYPPQPDSLRQVDGHPELRKYRNRNHYTIIGDDGSIQIEKGGQCLLIKPGQTRKRTP